MQGWENVAGNNGVSLAIVGMTVVFGVLLLLSLFIMFLPKALNLLHLVAPEAEEDRFPTVEASASASQDGAIAAAIGYAMHLERQKSH
jgi:sodium pump decarboxylase gamma subunit